MHKKFPILLKVPEFNEQLIFQVTNNSKLNENDKKILRDRLYAVRNVIQT